MQSRMDKYQTDDNKKYDRTSKNTKLYEDVYDDIYRDTSYKNMQVIDSAKEININKLKDMLDDKYDTRQYRTLKNYSIEDVDVDNTSQGFDRTREKVYDINEIINEAKNKRAFIEEAKEKKKYIAFTEGRNKKYDDHYDNMEQDEKELEELINTMAIQKQDEDTNDALDMLSDLKGEENTIVTNPIDTSFDIDTGETSLTTDTNTNTITNDINKTLVKADKTFYTDSNMFTKNDFEDFSTLTKSLGTKGKKKKALLIVLILLILAACTYLVITKIILK